VTDLPRHVADTHTILWHLDNDSRLSATARSILSEADEGRGWVYVSAISLVEMVYLAERGRVAPTLVERAFDMMLPPDGSFSPVDVDIAIVRALQGVPRPAIPDMPDRIIVATALQRGRPLISRDERIRNAGVVPIVW
jgi:PIN domain nuclease of toxin-antitoxin system